MGRGEPSSLCPSDNVLVTSTWSHSTEQIVRKIVHRTEFRLRDAWCDPGIGWNTEVKSQCASSWRQSTNYTPVTVQIFFERQ